MTSGTPFPLVSVIIPCYAQGHYLHDAITSVLGQTYRPFELIVVNDGSPDSAVIEAVLGPYREQVTYVVQANKGLSGARNTGLAHAQGEFVTFLDADDRLLPRALQAGVDAFAVHPASGLVWGLNRLIDPQGKLLHTRARTFTLEGGYAVLLERNIVGPPVGVMFRRTTLLAAGAFSTSLRFAEDYELYLRLARQHGIYCHREVIAEYRRHDSNMSHDHHGMLIGVRQVLDLQEEWVRGDPALRRMLQKGRRQAMVSEDGEPRLVRLGEHVRAGRWFQAVGCALVLLVKYPRLLLRPLAQRARRALSPEQT